MLLYNTTYTLEAEVERNFLIWIKECYIPQVIEDGKLHSPRLMKILSHSEDGTLSYSLQFEVKDSSTLHAWHLSKGRFLNEELLKVFKDKIIGFPTLMEILD